MEQTAQRLFDILNGYLKSPMQEETRSRELPRVALVHLCKPGWLGESLTQKQQEQISFGLKEWLDAPVSVHEPVNLLHFCEYAVFLLTNQIPNQANSELIKRRTIKRLIEIEKLSGDDNQAIISRVASKYVRLKKHENKGKRYTAVEACNPLRQTMALPDSAGVFLPKEDIRTLLLNSQLSDLFQEASCFSPEVLKQTLGPDLFDRLQVIGFADRLKNVVLIQVKSSSVAHEMAFRKREILEKLRDLQVFKQVADIRFSVSY